MIEAASSRVKKKLIGKKLTQSIKRMPLTFDMWLMTFGLALEHISLKSHLREIASEFFGIWKSSFIELSPQSTIKGRQWINKVSTSGNEVKTKFLLDTVYLFKNREFTVCKLIRS